MENSNNSRRSFIKKAATGILAAISIREILSAAVPGGGSKKIKLLTDQVILFQGDSITDAGRNKEDNSSNNPGRLDQVMRCLQLHRYWKSMLR